MTDRPVLKTINAAELLAMSEADLVYREIAGARSKEEAIQFIEDALERTVKKEHDRLYPPRVAGDLCTYVEDVSGTFQPPAVTPSGFLILRVL
jgi:hypothetical protein